MLPRVFDHFAQAPGALDRAQGGMGIGLTLVKRLVELHGGTVQASSQDSMRSW
jgi:signal transduction histidine kinase